MVGAFNNVLGVALRLCRTEDPAECEALRQGFHGTLPCSCSTRAVVSHQPAVGLMPMHASFGLHATCWAISTHAFEH